MAETKSFSMRGLFNSNKFVLFFSIIASIVFWATITIIEAPNTDKTINEISVAIPIDGSVAQKMGLDVIGDAFKTKVSVTVNGPTYIVSKLSAQDISVTASLSKVNDAGTYDLDLKAKNNSQAGVDYDIISVSPSTLTVTFDYIDTKQFPVVAQAVGASAVGGLIAEDPVVSDPNNSTVTIKGPRTDILKIDKVVATAKVNQTLSKTASFDADLDLYDENNNKLNKSVFTILAKDASEIGEFQVSIPISKSKTVPIRATFTNVPAGYASLPLTHTLSYSKIDIIGPPDIIDSISEVQLAPIDFDLISNNNTGFTVAVALQEGVRSVDHIETVSVVFTEMKNFSTRIFSVSNISVTPTGAKATLKRNINNVKICGPKSIMKKLKASDLYAVIDVTGKPAGENSVTVRIKSKTYNQVWQVSQVSPYVASVVVQ